MPRDVVLTDRGWNRIRGQMRELSRSSVKVGLRAGPANDGVQIVDYAAMNEFGTETIPARPFMRHTADTQENNARAYVRRLVPALLEGRMAVDNVLEAVGQWYQAALKRTIRQAPSWAEPNAKATIAAKGSSAPLKDHGMLEGAIDYEKIRR
jgi:hypothetical protein